MTNLYKEMNKIVDETDERQVKPLTEDEKMKLKNNFIVPRKKEQQKKKWLPAAVAAAVLTLSSLPFLNDDVQAAAGRMIDQLETSFNHMFPDDVKNYSTKGNKTIAAESADIKLSDAFVENNKIHLNTQIEMKDNKEYQQLIVTSLKINGKLYNFQPSFSNKKIINNKNNMISEVLTLNAEKPLPKGKLDIQFKIDQLSFTSHRLPKIIKQPNWVSKNIIVNSNPVQHLQQYEFTEIINQSYRINTNEEKLLKQTKQTVIHQSVTTIRRKVNIDKFEINPVIAYFTYKFEGFDAGFQYYLIDNHHIKYYPQQTSNVNINGQTFKKDAVASKDRENTIEHLKKAKSLKFILIERDNNEDTQNYEKIIKKTDLNDAFEFIINH